MGLTTAQLPYPETTDSVDVPRDIRALAEATDGRMFVPPPAFTTVMAGTLSTTRPIVTVGFLVTITTNASGDGPAAIPAGITFASIIGATLVGRGSTAFNITGFLLGSTSLTTLQWRVYNANAPAASTSIAVFVQVTGQRP